MRVINGAYLICVASSVVYWRRWVGRRRMAAENHLHAEIASLEKRLTELDGEREGLLASLEKLKLRYNAEVKLTSSPQILGDTSAATALSNAEKVTLFRSFFRGRDDVFPQRWENSKTGKAGYSPACHNEWVRGICDKPRTKCSNCLNQAFVPVTDDVVRSHLQGRDLTNSKRAGGFVAGVYPLLSDGTCWFLAAALPLQNEPRHDGNSVFVDDELRPYENQWGFLSSLRRMSRGEVATVVARATAAGQILGVRLPLDDDDEEPWTTSPSRQRAELRIVGEMPEQVEVVLSNQVYIDRSALPPALVNRLIRLAAFQNPEFYSAQAMRLPTFGKPRVISCAELFIKHIALPRGCLDAALDLLASHGIKPNLCDERRDGTPLGTLFLGTLTSEQRSAAEAVMAHNNGVLAATTAFGKTVVAASLIAERNTNTLVLVHRQQLLDQWVARLRAFLDIDPNRIGVVSGGKKRPTGVIDVAIIQSLVRKGEVSDLVADYGHLVIDECHHLSAVSFEAPLRPNTCLGCLPQ